MARSYSAQWKWLARLTSVATKLKWGFLSPIQLLGLAGGLLWLLQWIGKRKGASEVER